MSEKFCLKWNDFHSNVSKSFGIFRNEDYLHDVTLISDDQHQVTAHKLVLSASSEYFRNIFKNNKHPNPLLCLDGLSSTDLDNILDYIYNGEIQIYQDYLDRFLTIAQRFKLEGLLGGEKYEEVENITFPNNFDPPSKRANHPEEVKSESEHTSNTTIQLNIQIPPMDTTDMEELDKKLCDNMDRNSDGDYFCKICSKTAKKRKDMKFHVETHVEGVSFPCNTCGKEFRSRNVLRNHKSLKRHQ